MEFRFGSSKGINWCSWNNISMTNNKGGLGFRNLYGFNIALLGKHCWNLCITQILWCQNCLKLGTSLIAIF